MLKPFVRHTSTLSDEIIQRFMIAGHTENVEDGFLDTSSFSSESMATVLRSRWWKTYKDVGRVQNLSCLSLHHHEGRRKIPSKPHYSSDFFKKNYEFIFNRFMLGGMITRNFSLRTKIKKDKLLKEWISVKNVLNMAKDTVTVPRFTSVITSLHLDKSVEH